MWAVDATEIKKAWKVWGIMFEENRISNRK